MHINLDDLWKYVSVSVCVCVFVFMYVILQLLVSTATFCFALFHTCVVHKTFRFCTNIKLCAQCITQTFFTDCLFTFVYRCWYYSSSLLIFSSIYFPCPFSSITVQWFFLNDVAWKELSSSMTCKSDLYALKSSNIFSISSFSHLFIFLRNTVAVASPHAWHFL